MNNEEPLAARSITLPVSRSPLLLRFQGTTPDAVAAWLRAGQLATTPR